MSGLPRGRIEESLPGTAAGVYASNICNFVGLRRDEEVRYFMQGPEMNYGPKALGRVHR